MGWILILSRKIKPNCGAGSTRSLDVVSDDGEGTWYLHLERPSSLGKRLLHPCGYCFRRCFALLCFELCIQKRQPFRSSKKHISSHHPNVPPSMVYGGGLAASRNHRSIFAASINLLHITRTTSPLLLRRLRVSCSC
jgi:hypothetical protein